MKKLDRGNKFRRFARSTHVENHEGKPTEEAHGQQGSAEGAKAHRENVAAKVFVHQQQEDEKKVGGG